MARPRKVFMEADWLKTQYVDMNKSTTAIAKEIGCTSSTVLCRLREFKIPTKSRHFAHLRAGLPKGKPELKGIRVRIDPDWMKEQYVDFKRSDKEIAALLGCSETTVRRRRLLYNQGITQPESAISSFKCGYCGKTFESYSSANRIYCSHDCYGKANRAKVAVICAICGKEFKTKPVEIARNKGKYCSRKCQYEAQSGEGNKSWLGGISFEPYCPKFTHSLREDIREKFKRKCYLCSKTDIENGRNLSIHHVDYNKGQGCGQRWSLISLCHSCHAKTNYNRHHWFNLLSNYWATNPEIRI